MPSGPKAPRLLRCRRPLLPFIALPALDDKRLLAGHDGPAPEREPTAGHAFRIAEDLSPDELSVHRLRRAADREGGQTPDLRRSAVGRLPLARVRDTGP